MHRRNTFEKFMIISLCLIVSATNSESAEHRVFEFSRKVSVRSFKAPVTRIAFSSVVQRFFSASRFAPMPCLQTAPTRLSRWSFLLLQQSRNYHQWPRDLPPITIGGQGGNPNIITPRIPIQIGARTPSTDTPHDTEISHDTDNSSKTLKEHLLKPTPSGGEEADKKTKAEKDTAPVSG